MPNLALAAKRARKYIAANIPVMIVGNPGIGKSDIMRAIAAKDFGGRLIDQRATQIDPVDLRGLPNIVNGMTCWAIPSFLPQVARDGETGILFFDELNAAALAVQVALYQLILDRKLGDYELPAGWRVAAAGNLTTDGAAAREMSSALANRFAHITVEPDAASWRDWAMSGRSGLESLPDLPSSPADHSNGLAKLAAFIGYRPELIHVMPKRGQLAFPSPRSYAMLARVISDSDDRQGTAAGLIGDAAATELEAFLRLYESLPPIAQILSDPDRAPVPNDVGTRWAVSTALAAIAEPRNFSAILRYVARLSAEFQTVCVTDAVNRSPALRETDAFTQWSVANSQNHF